MEVVKANGDSQTLFRYALFMAWKVAGSVAIGILIFLWLSFSRIHNLSLLIALAGSAVVFAIGSYLFGLLYSAVTKKRP
jgi:hypothetical protein